jgi:hypothetical protein
MMDSLRVTVFEDKSKFDGASDSVIREHFKKRAANAVEEEQGLVAGRTLREVRGMGTAAGRSQRYRFNIFLSPPRFFLNCLDIAFR